MSKIQFQLLASSMSGKDGNIPYHFLQLAGMAASTVPCILPFRVFGGNYPIESSGLVAAERRSWLLLVGVCILLSWSAYY